MKIWKITSALLFLASSTNANAVILHHNTWETGSPSTYTTNFGNPVVTGSTGVFSSNSLAFNTEGNNPSFYYDQIDYAIGTESSPYSAFNVSFDIYTENQTGSNNHFVILVDTPTVRNLYFTNEGNIELQPGWASRQVLSAYNENESMHIDMLFDIGNNIWDISLNSTTIYSGIIDNTSNPYLNPAEYLRSIRFSQGLVSSIDTPSHESTVYLDNVVISAVPLPAAVWLFVSGITGLFGLARFKRN